MSTALKAVIDGDESGLNSALDRSLAKAAGWSTKFSSTVNNRSQAMSAGDAYAKWWGEAMLKRDVETATRANRARELLRERAAGRAGKMDDSVKEIQSYLNRATGGGSGGGGGHGGGQSGAMREALVLMREMSRGNWSRVPGSFSILIQQMGILRLVFRSNATAAQVVADAWGKQAIKAGEAAIAAAQQAAASEAAALAEGEEAVATRAAAAADRAKAKAAIENAVATRAKAEAAKAAATEGTKGVSKGFLGMLRSLGGIAVGPIAIIAGILLAIGAGAWAASKLVRGLTDRLAGLGAVADTHLEYIAKAKQASHAAEEAQKNINEEVERSVRLYNSAAKAAERAKDITKDHYEHLRKMLDYQEQAELKSAKTEKDKAAVRAKYTDARLKLGDQERGEEITNKQGEQNALVAESVRLQKEADSIKVDSKEKEDQNLSKLKQKADDADKFLEGLNSINNPTDLGFTEVNFGKAKENLFRGFNAASLSGVSGEDLDVAEKKNPLEAAERKAAYRKAVDKAAEDDRKRQQKDTLYKEAGKAASDAVVSGLEVAEMKKTAAQKAKDDREEAAAKLAADNSQESKSKFATGHLTNLQQIGAFAGPASLINVHRNTERNTARTAKAVEHMSQVLGTGGRGGHLGKVKYG